MIRVLIVDDHTMVRLGLERLLESYGDIEVVGSASSGEQALELTSTASPQVVLMDMAMPGMDGIDTTRQLVAQHPDVIVIALSTHNDPRQVVGALDAGAHGYLVKDVEPDVLVAGIRSVLDGGAPLSPSVAGHLLRGGWQLEAPASRLTRRELSIAPHRRRAPQQADRSGARHQREDRQDTLQPAVPTPRCVGPDSGRGLGRAESARASQLTPFDDQQHGVVPSVDGILVRPHGSLPVDEPPRRPRRASVRRSAGRHKVTMCAPPDVGRVAAGVGRRS
jgi:DNA-binding NarL/FixJ family response regulator